MCFFSLFLDFGEISARVWLRSRFPILAADSTPKLDRGWPIDEMTGRGGFKGGKTRQGRQLVRETRGLLEGLGGWRGD